MLGERSVKFDFQRFIARSLDELISICWLKFYVTVLIIYRILKPGGYIELSEFEHSPEEGGPYFAMFGEEFKRWF